MHTQGKIYNLMLWKQMLNTFGNMWDLYLKLVIVLQPLWALRILKYSVNRINETQLSKIPKAWWYSFMWGMKIQNILYFTKILTGKALPWDTFTGCLKIPVQRSVPHRFDVSNWFQSNLPLHNVLVSLWSELRGQKKTKPNKGCQLLLFLK